MIVVYLRDLDYTAQLLWILSYGIWKDDKVWKDTATWED